MSIEINLPPMFCHLAGTGAVVFVSGETVSDCLGELVRLHSPLKEYIFDDAGEIKPGLTVFLNGENAFPGELTKPVKNGDVLHLAQLVLGG